MSDYFHASDLQAALAALTSIQEYFHEMYRIFSDSITEQRRIFLFFAARIREGRFYACAQTWLRHFCVTVCTQISSRKRSSKRGIKSEDATPLLRLLFRPSSCKRSLREISCLVTWSTSVSIKLLHMCMHTQNIHLGLPKHTSTHVCTRIHINMRTYTCVHKTSVNKHTNTQTHLGIQAHKSK